MKKLIVAGVTVVGGVVGQPSKAQRLVVPEPKPLTKPLEPQPQGPPKGYDWLQPSEPEPQPKQDQNQQPPPPMQNPLRK